jgi:hypothetical protein
LLDTLIQKIARCSNSQNKVSEADFFSNHPFHRAMERRSRAIKAPAAEGAQFSTFWFYERARGQYINEQSKMTLKQKNLFQRENPRAQLIVKTDLAKYENSWRKLPHIVSRGAQKNLGRKSIQNRSLGRGKCISKHASRWRLFKAISASSLCAPIRVLSLHGVWQNPRRMCLAAWLIRRGKKRA